MAVCRDCDQEMTTAATCTAEILEIHGAPHPRKRWRPRWRAADVTCHDCGVAPGGVHHRGCDEERCPACGWQLTPVSAVRTPRVWSATSMRCQWAKGRRRSARQVMSYA